ncbi:MAG: O-antigen ligase domain-containing protein, partial [Chloroflexi bacterium]
PTLRLTDWLALGWLTVSLLSAATAWQWRWTPSGFWWLVLGPLLFYTLGRTVADTAPRRAWAVSGLAGGGILAALIGLALWWGGEGTAVDGVRRLVGLTFSPNQTALLLVRALFVCAGLGIATPDRCADRDQRSDTFSYSAHLSGVGVVLIALAILLTGSRGALLLGVPAGAALFLLLQPGIQQRLTRRPWLVAVTIVVLLAGAGLLFGQRLLNSATVTQRLHIWQGAWELWQAYPWLGAGPGGFFWRYPALMTAAAANEPNLLHPHNIWLEFVTGWGVAGLVWVIALCSWLIRRITGRLGSVSGVELGLLAGLVAGIAHGQVDAFGALPELAAWNWLVIGLLSNNCRSDWQSDP